MSDPASVQWTPELEATHRGLSWVDLEFRRQALHDPGLLSRERFSALDQHRGVLAFRAQPWPTFVGGSKMGELRGLGLAICNLVRSVPQRLWKGDPAGLARFYALPSPEVAELFMAPPNGIAESVARGDFIDTSDGFKCIEFNFSADLAGWETALLIDMYMAVPEIAGFLSRYGIEPVCTNTVRKLFSFLAEDLLRRGLCGAGELNVVFTLPQKSSKKAGVADAVGTYVGDELQAALAESGIDLEGRVAGAVFPQLTRRGLGIFLGDMEVHAVIDFSEELVPRDVIWSFKAGKVGLLNGPIEKVLSEKRNLALLSESVESGPWDDRERERIRRHIPWSRQVLPVEVELHGERAFLPELLSRRREELVLKDGFASGGKGVALGRVTAPARWSEIVEGALERGGWMVQELLESLPYLYQCGDYGCAVHDVIWGPFVFGPTDGGVILRMQPKQHGSAVNLNLQATEGIVIEVDGDSETVLQPDRDPSQTTAGLNAPGSPVRARP